jgi:hypothetical protein
MSATASHLGNPMSAHESRVVSIGQFGSTNIEPSGAPSALSLSMMRQAFGGLRVNTERSLSSSTEQRGGLEREIEQSAQLCRQASAFAEERYSYDAVSESDFANVTSSTEGGQSSDADFLVTSQAVSSSSPRYGRIGGGDSR